jgi:His-Xaa-Ser system radical SAM maturase HxsB
VTTPSSTTRERSIRLPVLLAEPSSLGYFRWGRVDEQVVLSNDAGEWELLSDSDFTQFLAAAMPPSHPRFRSLQEKGFLRQGLDLEALASRVRRKKRFLGVGPHLHVLITTLRCNQDCRYCHASRADMDRVDTDMSLETAKKAVDVAMQSTSPYINFEFQGGEPTVNFPVIEFALRYAREKNRVEGKRLDFSLVTNMTAMDETKAEWLLANDVLVCTSLDGPQDLHDWNRTWRSGGGASAHAQVVRWIRWFNRRYVEMGRDPNLWHVDALLTTTRRSLDRARDIVDSYRELGIRNVHLRPLNPFGFAMRTWERIGYDIHEFLRFYEQALDYIIELNRQGHEMIEGTAAVFLTKLLSPDDPDFVDIRSPQGSGTGQVAYSYDGTILPSDEGRMVDAMGDPIFRLGNVASTKMADVVRHPSVKAITAASLLDALPQCADCWNAPFCGLMPLHSYMQGRDLFGQRPNTFKCQQHMEIVRMLLRRLGNDPDGSIARIFHRWTVTRARLPEGAAPA